MKKQISRRSKSLRSTLKTGCAFGLLLACALAMQSPIASAIGIFTLKGKVQAFDEKTYKIATKAMIYEVDRSKLNNDQLAILKSKKSGGDVELTITTESLISVRDKPKK